MELAGGLLVVLVMVWLGMTICAGGLCTEEKQSGAAKKEIKR